MPSPLSNEIIDMRHDRFVTLLNHFDVDDDARGPGSDPEGRYVVTMRVGGPVIGARHLYRLVRTSSIARANVVAEHNVKDGWIPMHVYDLDTMIPVGSDSWPARHDIALERAIVVFNTVATPNPHQEV